MRNINCDKGFVSIALSCIIIGEALAIGGSCNAAIIYPKPPEGGHQVVYKYLSAELKPHNMLDFLGISRIEDMSIAKPYGDYGLVTMTNVFSGQLLSSTKLYGWCYFVMDGTNAVGAMFLHPDKKDGRTLTFGQLTRGLVSETEEALRVARALPQVKQRDYELRGLNIPSILFHAVWLHGKSDDIIIPLPPTWGGWKAYQVYSESQIIKLLKPAVENKLREPSGMLD